MPRSTIDAFLAHESQNFLAYGARRAAALRDRAGLGDFEREMYEAWEDYFEELAEQSCRMLALGDGRLQQALADEAAGLRQIADRLNESLDALTADGRALVGALRDLIEIERAATCQMLKQLDADASCDEGFRFDSALGATEPRNDDAS